MALNAAYSRLFLFQSVPGSLVAPLPLSILVLILAAFIVFQVGYRKEEVGRFMVFLSTGQALSIMAFILCLACFLSETRTSNIEILLLLFTINLIIHSPVPGEEGEIVPADEPGQN